MIYFVLMLSIGIFLICMKLLHVVESMYPIFATSRNALAVMRSGELTEEQKESAVRKAAGGMFRSFLSVTFRVALTLAVPAAFVAAGSATGLYTIDGAVSATTDWTFLIVSSIAVTFAFVAQRPSRTRRQPNPT